MKNWILVLLLLVPMASAGFAEETPAPPTEAKQELDLIELFSLPEAIPAACPASFCVDAQDCACSSASSATCNSLGRCVYTYGTNPTPTGPQSGDICRPARFCQEVGQSCGACVPSGQGVCGSDHVCRVP